VIFWQAQATGMVHPGILLALISIGIDELYNELVLETRLLTRR
jgi:hypothetical protein